MLKQLALLAIAGAFGTVARYGVYVAAQRLPGENLPLATLGVNVLGSFLFGLVWMMAEHGRCSPQARLLVLTGFMGAFTTFSTFAFESGQLIRNEQYLAAGANIAANNILGILAFVAGIYAARL